MKDREMELVLDAEPAKVLLALRVSDRSTSGIRKMKLALRALKDEEATAC